MVRLVAPAAGLFVLLSLPIAVRAQARLAGADLRGEVTDQSGGVVPNVAVTVVNTETNVTRQLETDPHGQFRALGLPPRAS